MKQRNLNSNKKTNPTQNYGSTYTVESEQKDLLLAKMKAEFDGLKKNQQEYHRLRDQYQEMDRKYRSLQDEKVNQDRDFKARHESCLKHICQLKNETEAMKAELRDKKLEIDDMETDGNTLRNSIDQKNIELDKFRAELNGLFADTDELEGERIALVKQLEEIRRYNEKLKQQADSLDSENARASSRTAEMEKYLDQLEIEGKLLKEKITSYEESNNRLDNEINEVIQDVSQIENQIYESQAETNGMHTALAELTADSEKYRSQAIHNQKATQAEVMKNNDLVKQSKQAEHILGVRMNQGEEGRKEIHCLNEENVNLEKINDQLELDLEACRRHLDNLNMLNNQLVRNLEGFSEEDEAVRVLIDRKEKVSYMKSRVGEVSSTMGALGKLTSRTEATMASRRSFRF